MWFTEVDMRRYLSTLKDTIVPVYLRPEINLRNIPVDTSMSLLTIKYLTISSQKVSYEHDHLYYICQTGDNAEIQTVRL